MLTQETTRSGRWLAVLAAAAGASVIGGCTKSRAPSPPSPPTEARQYEHDETRALVSLVTDAARLIETDGEAAFAQFRVPNSRWRQGEAYVFVLDPVGDMVVHPDPALEGKNELGLKDVNGRPIIRGLLQTATALPAKPAGWYHYEWPVPGGILPRWKSSYVRLAVTPSGKRFVVGSGIYNDRMERAFVVDLVKDAVGQIEARGEAAFPLLHDPTGPFLAKDAYVFVIDPRGVELVNPAFPNLEGRNVLDVRDTHGKPLVREMFSVVESTGAGWVNYLWPKPGQSVSTQKSTYVSKARIGDRWLLVGCGVYLPNAPTAVAETPKLTARELTALVRDGATLFEQRGEDAYAEFRRRGSKWFRDDTYFIVWRMDGTRVLNVANPDLEGQDASGAKDILGRPYGKMFLDVAASPSGEGWVHYMYPEPGNMFPAWKSVFVKRVASPSGTQHLIAAGIYNMQMDRAFIQDVVDRAAARVAEHGPQAFDELRDKRGPFVFMDTYVFVDKPDGTEIVNGGQPSLEGMNLMGLRDIRGKALARDYIAAALRDGSAWVDYYWYKPGDNTPAHKQSYVRAVRSGADTYIVGSGLYLAD